MQYCSYTTIKSRRCYYNSCITLLCKSRIQHFILRKLSYYVCLSEKSPTSKSCLPSIIMIFTIRNSRPFLYAWSGSRSRIIQKHNATKYGNFEDYKRVFCKLKNTLNNIENWNVKFSI